MIPIVIGIFFYIFFKKEIIWWEFFIPIAASIILIFVSKIIVNYSTITFDEYWGSYITRVVEEYPYNYWKNETCSYTTTDGKNTYTHYYDCSHQEDVGPAWTAYSNIGEEINLDERSFENIKKILGGKNSIIETRENYDPCDECVCSKGTKFEGKAVGKTSYVVQTVWNKKLINVVPYSSKHRYKNKIKASDLSIFNIDLITEDEADSFGLYKYPKLEDGFEFPTVLGKNIPNDVQDDFKKLNGRFGSSNQMRLWVLVFDDKPLNEGIYQENYWVRGNMNELVVCIGRKGNEIKWSHVFSWTLNNEICPKIESMVMNLYEYKDTVIKEKIPNPMKKNSWIEKDTTISKKGSYPVLTEKTWNDLYDGLSKTIPSFKRRNFEEFNYLSVKPTNLAIIIIIILTTMFSVGLNIVVIKNDTKPDNDKDEMEIENFKKERTLFENGIKKKTKHSIHGFKRLFRRNLSSESKKKR